MLEQQVHTNTHVLQGKITQFIKTPKVYHIDMETTRSKDGKKTNNVHVVVFEPQFSLMKGFKRGNFVRIEGYMANDQKKGRMAQNIVLTKIERAKSKLEALGFTKNSTMIERVNEGLYGGIVTEKSVSKKNNVSYLFLSITSAGHPTQVCIRFFNLPMNRKFLTEVKEGDNVVISATIQSKVKKRTDEQGIEHTEVFENLIGMEAVRVSQKAILE